MCLGGLWWVGSHDEDVSVQKFQNRRLRQINAFVAYGGWVPRNMGGGGAVTAEPKPKHPEHQRLK